MRPFYTPKAIQKSYKTLTRIIDHRTRTALVANTDDEIMTTYLLCYHRKGRTKEAFKPNKSTPYIRTFIEYALYNYQFMTQRHQSLV